MIHRTVLATITTVYLWFCWLTTIAAFGDCG